MGYGNLAQARDLRQIMRLDDLRKTLGTDVSVDSAVFLTHDLNLNFVLTELLPGLLVDPTAVPPGMGPGNRTAREPLLDLPPVVIVHAPEASVNCEVQWRPPTLELFPYLGQRRQHSKVTAILFSANETRWIRLVASSANLTRRAFATNLEVAAFEDYAIVPGKPVYPSLFELRGLLDAMSAVPGLENSRAFEAILRELPDRKGERSSETFHFVHSTDRETYANAIADWLSHPPKMAGDYRRTVVVSPFYSAKGEALHRYFRDRLEFGDADNQPIDVIVDGRAKADANAPHMTPPPWLKDYSSQDLTVYRPALLAGTDGGGTLRGTGTAGRPLHAKLFAVGYELANTRDARSVWRMLVGSSNFTDSGLGLVEGASLEAGFLIEYEEDELNQLLGPQPYSKALCVECALPGEEPRIEPCLEQTLQETARGKSALRCLAEGACEIKRVGNGRFLLELDLSKAQRLPDMVCLGKNLKFDNNDNAKFELETDTLVPYFLLLRFGDSFFQWPLPVDGLVEEILVDQVGLRDRRERLELYWLWRTGQTLESDGDGPARGDVTGSRGGETALGSWRLNRLLLGVRRRLTESLRGVRPRLPAAEQLMASIRTRELLTLATDQPPIDRLYFGTLLRATLLGYWAGEQKKPVDWADEKKYASILARWRRETAWETFEKKLPEAHKDIDSGILGALNDAAKTLYLSVRDREVPE